ncbi:MAG: hypothetical protein OHK93_004837 [Ramalina farinacea]|uniref:Uncharacterized protein n=1 Tax=Ramalina farinacea TaxID=258253 RepID=A0AA43TYU6_9LECA|nr:hypothetical protein [Ramalina farinacea]
MDDTEDQLEAEDLSEAESDIEDSDEDEWLGDTGYEVGESAGEVYPATGTWTSGSVTSPSIAGRVVNLEQPWIRLRKSRRPIRLRGSTSKISPRIRLSSSEIGKMVLKNRGFLA